MMLRKWREKRCIDTERERERGDKLMLRGRWRERSRGGDGERRDQGKEAGHYAKALWGRGGS